jgi:hypothetical protein
MPKPPAFVLVNYTGNDPAPIVDRLGLVKAQIAKLTLEEKDLKGVLASHGAGAYEGELYRATVSHSELETLDMDAVRAKLSRKFIEGHTKTTPVITVRVFARSGRGKRHA